MTGTTVLLAPVMPAPTERPAGARMPLAVSILGLSVFALGTWGYPHAR